MGLFGFQPNCAIIATYYYFPDYPQLSANAQAWFWAVGQYIRELTTTELANMGWNSVVIWTRKQWFICNLLNLLQLSLLYYS